MCLILPKTGLTGEMQAHVELELNVTYAWSLTYLTFNPEKYVFLSFSFPFYNYIKENWLHFSSVE